MAKRKRRRKKKPPKRTYQEKRFDNYQRLFVIQKKIIESLNKVLPFFAKDAHIDSITEIEPFKSSLRKKVFRISFVYGDTVYAIVHAEDEYNEHDLYKVGEIAVRNYEQMKDDLAKEIFKSADFIAEATENEEGAFDVLYLNQKVHEQVPQKFELFLLHEADEGPIREVKSFTFSDFKRLAPENISGKLRDEFYTFFTPGKNPVQEIQNTIEPPPDDWSYRVTVINLCEEPELYEAFTKFEIDFARYREKVILYPLKT